MKILCYYPWIYLKSGIERTLIQYAIRSRHQIVFATNLFVPDATFPEFSQFRVIQLPGKVSVRRALAPVAAAAFKIALTRLQEFDHDLLLVHNDGLADFILFRNHQKPAVCFCHTPLRIAYDSQYISQYCQGKQGRRLIVGIMGKIHKWIDRKAWRHYDYVFFNSQEVRRRCIEGGLATDRSSILHPGIDQSTCIGSTVREPFFLYGGRIMWTKNVESAILGFQTAKEQQFILVIAGMVDEKSVTYLSTLKRIAGNDVNISFVESPSDEKLHDLYRRCFAVIFPAYNEDWGLVPLEAMSFGKVVISSDTGGPTESMIDGKTGWLVRPNPEGIAAGIKYCVDHENLLDEMSIACVTRAREFTWDKFSEKMDDSLDNVFEKSKKYN
jgi:glycosyltransferase involved in cell wall biosynthesis